MKPEINNAFEEKLKKLADTVNNIDYFSKLRSLDNDLVNFLFDNFDIIAFHLFEDFRVSTLEYKLIFFLTIDDLAIRTRFKNETSLMEILLNYPFKFHNVLSHNRNSYINVLKSYIFCRDDKYSRECPNAVSIDKQFCIPELFRNLISVCDFEVSYTLLLDLINTDNSKIILYLIKIGIPEMLAQQIIGNKVLNFESQKLLIALINNNCEYDVADSLNKNGIILSFIANSFENINAYKNFLFLLKLYKFSCKYHLQSNWKTIEMLISSRIDDFRNIILKSHNWNQTANTCVLLLIKMIKFSKSYSPKDRIILFDLIEKFFSMPRCTTLHLTTLKYLKSIEKNGYFCHEDARQSHLITHIIENYKMRESQVVYAYWGPIRKISEIIDPYIDEGDKNEWNLIVTSKNKEIKKIIGEESTSTSYQKYVSIISDIAMKINANSKLIYIIAFVFLFLSIIIRYYMK